MWHFGVVCLLLLVSTSIANIDKKHNKYVTTLINAKWQETPIILEVSEYLNDENPDYFWRFIDVACQDGDNFINQGKKSLSN